MIYLKKAKEQEAMKNEIQNSVREIITLVKKQGDKGLKELTKKYDNTTRRSIKLHFDEIEDAMQWLNKEIKEDIDFAAKRIRDFANFQFKMFKDKEKEFSSGVILGHRILPISICGCYVPGGRYPLLTSALMSIIPAKVAGVEKVVACSPPGKDGKIHPGIVCAMLLAGADEIYCMGGAQAIAAMAFGTESVDKVDKIVGPGNAYVTEAKRQLNGIVGIDLLAGPSEVVVISDESAKKEYLASDLLAQAEHDINSRAILISTSEIVAKDTAEELKKQLYILPTRAIAGISWELNGEIIIANDLKEAASISNIIAPEHLELHVEDPIKIIGNLKAYGSLFVGENSPVVFGDKASGTNHILPTNGSARFSEGLWVGTFLRVATHQIIAKEGVKTIAPVAARQSEREGFSAHKKSAEIRLDIF